MSDLTSLKFNLHFLEDTLRLEKATPHHLCHGPPLLSSLPSPMPWVLSFCSHLLQVISTEERWFYSVSAIQILCSFNPFTDTSKGDDLLPVGTEDYTRIQIQQRNDRKILTTVQGIIG